MISCGRMQRPTYGTALRPPVACSLKLDKLWILADPQIQHCGHGCMRSLTARSDQPHLYGPIGDLPRGKRIPSRPQNLERGFVIRHAFIYSSDAKFDCRLASCMSYHVNRSAETAMYLLLQPLNRRSTYLGRNLRIGGCRFGSGGRLPDKFDNQSV